MKCFLLSVFLALVAVVPSFATGSVGIDPVQTGSVSFTAATATNQTVTFPYPFTTTPIVSFVSASGGAASAVSNSSVTTTNFSLTVVNTNSSVNWTAQVGYPRIESGTNPPGGGVLIFTNVFSPPFAFPPVVLVSGGSTNLAGGLVCVTNVTPSNFVATIGSGTSNTLIQWEAIGVTVTPGNYNPNFPYVTY